MSIDTSAIYALPPDNSGGQDWTIAGPGTFAGPWIDDLAGMLLLSAQVRFAFGTSSAGAAVSAYLQSSLDGGNTAFDVALVQFGPVTRSMILLVRPTQGFLAPTDATGSPEGVLAAVLGDRMRLKCVVTGTFQSTTLSARILPA